MRAHFRVAALAARFARQRGRRERLYRRYAAEKHDELAPSKSIGLHLQPQPGTRGSIAE